MAPQILVELGRINLIPLSLTSLCSCHSHSHSHQRPFTSRNLNLNRPDYRGLRFRLMFESNGPRGVFRIPRGTLVKPKHQRLITAVARAEQPERIDEEVNKGTQISVEENSDSEHQQKASQLKKRVIFGLGIGVSVGGVVLAGGWVKSLNNLHILGTYHFAVCY